MWLVEHLATCLFLATALCSYVLTVVSVVLFASLYAKLPGGDAGGSDRKPQEMHSLRGL